MSTDMLTKIRSIATPYARERLYLISVALVTMLSSFGTVDGAVVPSLLSLIGAALVLLFAAVQSSPGVRTAAYAVMAPLQGFLQLYGILSDAQWAGITGLVVAVLGLGLAAAKAPTAA